MFIYFHSPLYHRAREDSEYAEKTRAASLSTHLPTTNASTDADRNLGSPSSFVNQEAHKTRRRNRSNLARP